MWSPDTEARAWRFDVRDGTRQVVEPREVLKDAALDVMREAASGLRERGWPVELMVDYLPEKRTYVVSLRFEVPHIPIPVEAKGA